jgi:hypothetical protein
MLDNDEYKRLRLDLLTFSKDESLDLKKGEKEAQKGVRFRFGLGFGLEAED